MSHQGNNESCEPNSNQDPFATSADTTVPDMPQEGEPSIDTNDLRRGEDIYRVEETNEARVDQETPFQPAKMQSTSTNDVKLNEEGTPITPGGDDNGDNNNSQPDNDTAILKIQPSDRKNDDRIFLMNGGEKVKQPQKYKSNSISTTKYILGFKIHKNGWKLGPWGPIGLPAMRNRQTGAKIPGAKMRPFDLPYIQPPFIVQNLYEQLHRVANLYFILIIILQLIPGLSPTGRFSTMLPFAIVTIFSLLKDMFEDMKRRFGDIQTNNSYKACVFRKGEWTTVKWKSVKVGDIIKVVNKERFPCDIILLSSSQEQGLAYVETASLDGETNLKVKKALDDTIPIDLKSASTFRGRVVCQKPNKNLHKFNGRLYIGGPYLWKKVVKTPEVSARDPSMSGSVTKVFVRIGEEVKIGAPICDLSTSNNEQKCVVATHDCTVTHVPKANTVHEPGTPLWSFSTRLTQLENTPISFSGDQQLLRGSSLQNTDWIVGVVMYTGHESKLLMNQNPTPHKASKVEKLTNKFIVVIFGLLTLLCLVCACGTMINTATNSTKQWYINGTVPTQQELNNGLSAGSVFWTGFSGFFTFVILFNNLVPISLYVSMEMAKFAQAYFMTQDREMYYEEKDIPAVVRSSSLNEELGQVEYIFSDKTGTLTRNKMDFLKFSINGVVYGTGITEIERANAKRKGRELLNDRPPGFDENQDFRFWDGRINDGKWEDLPESDHIGRFFRLLALCHTVIPERDDHGNVSFNASSPDEGALVKAAKYLGAEFLSRTTHSMTIRIAGKEEVWQLLNILEFNSTRKRMSVVVRDPNGKLVLLTKGADNVIYERLSKEEGDNMYADESLQLLENLADAGLRTLVCAEATIDEEFYQEWRKEHQEVMMITDPDHKEQRMDEINEKLEKDLHLVGLTAIEDLLQIGVPDTIAELKKGQIKVWVLTGDKKETAINIGFACDLLNTDMDLIQLTANSQDDLSNDLQANYEQYKMEANRKNPLGLVINGDNLGHVMENEAFKRMFLELGTYCEAVVCCRVSPLQKAQVVALVKNNMNTITLAIGDGANDVPMIQAAHVGIGISGEEGQQAANASDYSFGQFRFLKRLLLVHGQYSYRRISKIILYSFYKNIVLYLTQLWYVAFNSWSGTSVHDKWTVSLFNVIFAFLPIMALGIFDRHISPTKAEQFPQLYARGHQNVYFNFWSFTGWVLNAVYHSCICFFVPILCMYVENDIEGTMWEGSSRDMLGLGITVYTAVLLTITGKAHLEMESQTILHVGSNLLSLVVWWIFIFLYACVYWVIPRYVFVIEETHSIMEGYRTLLSPRFYFTVILTAVLALAKDYIWKAVKRLSRNDLFYAVQDCRTPHVTMNMREEDRESMLKEWDETKDRILREYPMKIKATKLKGTKKSKLPAPVEEIGQQIKKISVSNRGFAFSQTPGQNDILNKILSHSVGGPTPSHAAGQRGPSLELQDQPATPQGDDESYTGSQVDDDNVGDSGHDYGELGTTFEV
eukprot:CAMPEP_0117442084 /NCGR_PEP_ID=MMETSP0759-20121206/3968_1 /TAXON_ID=63605 /ORGANISM="Percolomonas cosmopolitus, Strain WS" /LENGTH=1496 /DNA_ID=CAMNT_0005233959 /DNA_START=369 /DNA_END=4859 /DNA_ORIENTATION=-